MLDPINISIDGSPVLSPSPAGAQPAQALPHRDLVSSPGPPPLPHSPVLSPMPYSENNRFRYLCSTSCIPQVGHHVSWNLRLLGP